MNEVLKKLLAQPTIAEQAENLLAAFKNDRSDQALARIFVIDADGFQVLNRFSTAITDYDVRLKIERRNITRWLSKGYRVVLVADDIGTEADCHVSSCWGLMITKEQVGEIIAEHGNDWEGFDAECWDLYNTGRDRWGKEPMIEASRVFEWLGY